uniref:Uncharacterized protein n=1 Tax=Meleagris gallopavo TaxID=9103 RepID=A0A803XRA2_MELGA
MLPEGPDVFSQPPSRRVKEWPLFSFVTGCFLCCFSLQMEKLVDSWNSNASYDFCVFSDHIHGIVHADASGLPWHPEFIH